MRSDQKSRWNLFKSNAWLFIMNAEMILDNEELFFTPVVEDYAPAFSNKETFRHPILGVYVEWWLRYAYASRDVEGNPVVCFIGNPQTGSHSCASVNKDGETVRKCPLQVSWTTTMKTYYTVNDKYNDRKGTVPAMTLEEAIEYIKGHTTKEIREKSKEKEELLGLAGDSEYYQKLLQDSRNENSKIRSGFIRCYLDSHRHEIEERLAQLHVCRVMAERYRVGHQEEVGLLRLVFKDGSLTQQEYQRRIKAIKKEQNRLEWDVHNCISEIVDDAYRRYGVMIFIYEVEDVMRNGEL